VAVLAWALSACGEGQGRPRDGIDPRDQGQVARGASLYRQHCASCHGANLEGQPDWRSRRVDGRLPAPPHDDSGHTWHHSNRVLMAITRDGMVPPEAPPNYASDMPAFRTVFSDEDIRAVLSFIESRWSAEVWKARREMVRDQR
jgi:mono/diheme cytochrome c family protein